MKKEKEVDERLLKGGRKRGRGGEGGEDQSEEGKEKNNNGNIRTSEGPRVVVPRGK